MPRRNRVDPSGRLHAVAARGLLMGNRGCLHDDTGELTRRRWTTRAWIACRLSFRDRHQVINAPRHYTQLFFLDEATALAAGHRPCAECRRADFRAFMDALRAAGMSENHLRAPIVDRILHAERELSGRTAHPSCPLAALPDGAIVRPPDQPTHYALSLRGRLYTWSFRGYGAPVAIDPDTPVRPVTPPLVIKALSRGYPVAIHPSAASS